MMESPKKHDTHVEYESVKYDKSIEFIDGRYLGMIRFDDFTLKVRRDTLLDVQKTFDLFEDDVFEQDDCPWSVFCHPDSRKHSEWLEDKLEEGAHV